MKYSSAAKYKTKFNPIRISKYPFSIAVWESKAHFQCLICAVVWVRNARHSVILRNIWSGMHTKNLNISLRRPGRCLMQIHTTILVPFLGFLRLCKICEIHTTALGRTSFLTRYLQRLDPGFNIFHIGFHSHILSTPNLKSRQNVA